MENTIDLGKYLAHWVLVAWSEDASGHIVDYGRVEVPSDHLGVEKAIMVALREFRDQAVAGWPIENANGEKRSPQQIWIDAGYMTSVVYSFCREAGSRYMPAVGRGAAQQRHQVGREHLRRIGVRSSSSRVRISSDHNSWISVLLGRFDIVPSSPRARPIFGFPPPDEVDCQTQTHSTKDPQPEVRRAPKKHADSD